MELLRKYATQTDIYFPLIKVSSQDFAVSANYTHVAGDVKVSKDGGAAATATNTPSAITMGNGAIWKLTLTATEMTAGLVVVTIIDAATKAIEDQAILIATYGNASAQYAFDLGTALTAAGIATSVWNETLTEPAAVFTWAGSMRNAMNWLAALSRNKITQTATTETLRNDADSASISTSTVANDGTTFTRGEWS